MTLQVNDKVTCSDGEEYLLTKELAAGGQGKTWIATRLSDNGRCVFKISFETRSERRLDKSKNIQSICNNRQFHAGNNAAQTFKFMAPLASYNNKEDDGTYSLGYVMEYADGCTSFSEMFRSGEFDKMPFENKCKIMANICDAIAFLHKLGLAYQDISYSNFLYDKASGKVIVIDCDNISANMEIENGDHAYVMGTGWFIAPEVAYLGRYAGKHADRYAMAVVFYMILTGSLDSPYHGELLYQIPPLPPSMVDVAKDETWADDLGQDWLIFIFDPENTRNSIANLCKNSTSESGKQLREKFDRYTKNWNALPQGIKDLFVKAFRNPLNTFKKRPLPIIWKREFEKQYKQILKPIPKSVSMTASKSVPDKKGVSGTKQKDTIPVFVVKQDTKTIPLSLLIPDKAGDRPLANIKRSKKSNVVSLINVSGLAIQCSAGTESKIILRNESITLEDGMILNLSTNPTNRIQLKLE